MDPRTLTRAARDEIRTILGDPAFHGGRLAEAIRALGERHAIEPFRACLGVIAPLDRAEPEARQLILSIEQHRSGMQRSLGRDPGFAIAAIDYLHDVERLVRDPLSPAGRAEPPAAPVRREGPAIESLQRALEVNVRRGERFGRPLTLAVLRPDRAAAGGSRLSAVTVAALRGAVRDVDHAARILPEGFAVIMPCTAGLGGVATAERLRALLTNTGGASWSAGVASCPEHPWDAHRLSRRSQEALVQARGRGGDRTVWSHPERRAARRRAIDQGGLNVSLPGRTGRRPIAIDDLSMSGARLRTDTSLAHEKRVTLTLSGTSARSRHVALSARVVRAERGLRGSDADWSIGLQFVDDEPARSGIAGLIADLPPERRPGKCRS